MYVYVCFHTTVAELNTCSLSIYHRNHINLQKGKYKVAEDLQAKRSIDRSSEGTLSKDNYFMEKEKLN